MKCMKYIMVVLIIISMVINVEGSDYISDRIEAEFTRIHDNGSDDAFVIHGYGHADTFTDELSRYCYDPAAFNLSVNRAVNIGDDQIVRMVVVSIPACPYHMHENWGSLVQLYNYVEGNEFYRRYIESRIRIMAPGIEEAALLALRNGADVSVAIGDRRLIFTD
jgi:hypothetical protein